MRAQHDDLVATGRKTPVEVHGDGLAGVVVYGVPGLLQGCCGLVYEALIRECQAELVDDGRLGSLIRLVPQEKEGGGDRRHQYDNRNRGQG
jgi:hypothetical protein